MSYFRIFFSAINAADSAIAIILESNFYLKKKHLLISTIIDCILYMKGTRNKDQVLKTLLAVQSIFVESHILNLKTPILYY